MDYNSEQFYATAVLKLVVATILLKYNCELSPIRGQRSFQWRVIGDAKTKHQADGTAERQQYGNECQGLMQCGIM